MAEQSRDIGARIAALTAVVKGLREDLNRSLDATTARLEDTRRAR